ncbi:uncharacterized protein LOC142026647 isoform X2 [Buteo buteo]|uniref:uncharacterized protein LOC142026647 isoform X2 n=1 Tax=Buteo buteo TaxID=30397 RepID=UPI003EB8381D
MSVNEAQLGTLAKRMWKMSASMGAKEEPPEGATAVEGTDNGTDREKRKTSILEIVAAYESERNEKLVDVRCCADIPPCFIPPLSTQVLASGMQIYPRGAITLSRAIAGCPERPSLCPAGHGRGETTQLLRREKQGILLQTQARSLLWLLQGRDDLSKAESCEPFPVAHHSFFKPESMPCVNKILKDFPQAAERS